MQPIQPIKDGRFQKNAIVEYLLDWATERGMGMNEIAVMDFSKEDRQQFAQLIGYSLSGYSSLTNYVDDDAYNAAAKMAEGKTEDQARIEALKEELDTVRKSLQKPMARLFGIHPDDLAMNINE